MNGTGMSRRGFLDMGRGTAIVTLAAAAAPATVFAQAGRDAAARGAVHGLKVSVGAGVRSETWLNGILLMRTEAGEASMGSLAIQHDMVPGGNLAEVRIGLADMNLEQPSAPVTGTLPAVGTTRLLLQIDEPSRVGGDLEIVTRDVDQLVWAPEDEGSRAMSLPHRLALKFSPQTPIVPPPWTDATRDLPDGTAEAVYARMAELASMLRNGNLDAYQDAGTVRREHMARSYPLGPNAADARKRELEELKLLRSEPGFAVTLLPRSEARFRTMALGRLMDWTNAAGESALMVASRGGPPSPVNMQFGLIRGKLVMTR